MKYILSHRLLKGTLHERSCVLTVDTVTRDGHQVSAARHGVAEQSQVTVVDIGTVERDDVVQLPLQGFSHCLDSQNLSGANDQHQTSAINPTEGNLDLLFLLP